MNKKPLNYSDYLKLEDILNSQELKSAERGIPAHDEILFIIIQINLLPYDYKGN